MIENKENQRRLTFEKQEPFPLDKWWTINRRVKLLCTFFWLISELTHDVVSGWKPHDIQAENTLLLRTNIAELIR